MFRERIAMGCTRNSTAKQGKSKERKNMFNRIIAIGAGVALCLTSFSAKAAIIDTFDAGNFAASGTGTFTQTGLSTSHVLGGERQVVVSLSATSGPVTLDTVVLGGSADLSSGTGEVATWWFRYGISTPLLSPADLSDGGLSDRFNVLFNAADLNSNLLIRVTDSDNDVSMVTTPITSNITTPTSIHVFFSSFNALINFASIKSVEIAVQGVNSGDYNIDFLETTGTIPAPAALPAGLVLLGGLALLRRRRLV